MYYVEKCCLFMYSLRTFLEILIHSSLDTFEMQKDCSISFKLGHTNVVSTMLYNTKQNITTATNTKITYSGRWTSKCCIANSCRHSQCIFKHKYINIFLYSVTRVFQRPICFKLNVRTSATGQVDVGFLLHIRRGLFD